jgi:hypothetical protein
MAATAARKTSRKRIAALAETSEYVRTANAAASSRGFVSGLNIDLGRINEEYVPALKSWPARMDLYQRMGNDAKIAAVLRANILPIISAVRTTVEGGTDEVKEHVKANLLRQGDPRLWCETSWTQRLFESLLSLQYGVSLFGKSREVVDGLMIFRRLTYLHPKSLDGPRGPWEWDATGTRLVAVHRRFKKPDGGIEFDERIPVDDLFPVVWWMAGENWEGVPMIRSMYRAYTEKDIASKIQMIDLQNRGVGIPDAELAPGDGAKQAATLEQIVKDMRGGSKERQFILRSPGQKVGFLTTSGTVLDSSPIIDGKNNEIAAAAGADFQQQGQTNSGSRATGSVLMVNYMQELDAIRELVQEQINHGAGYCRGLVEELTEQFGPQEEETHIVMSRVSPTEQLDNVPNILDGIQKGGLTHDLSVENHIRKAMGIAPLTSDDFNKLKSEGQRVPNIGGRPNEPTPTEIDDARNDSTSRAFGLSEKKTVDFATRTTRSARSYGWLESTAS